MTQLTQDQVKYLLYYGKTKDGIELNSFSSEVFHLDYFLEIMFDLMAKETVFDVGKAKELFWSRITEMANNQVNLYPYDTDTRTGMVLGEDGALGGTRNSLLKR